MFNFFFCVCVFVCVWWIQPTECVQRGLSRLSLTWKSSYLRKLCFHRIYCEILQAEILQPPSSLQGIIFFFCDRYVQFICCSLVTLGYVYGLEDMLVVSSPVHGSMPMCSKIFAGGNFTLQVTNVQGLRTRLSLWSCTLVLVYLIDTFFWFLVLIVQLGIPWRWNSPGSDLVYTFCSITRD